MKQDIMSTQQDTAASEPNQTSAANATAAVAMTRPNV